MRVSYFGFWKPQTQKQELQLPMVGCAVRVPDSSLRVYGHKRNEIEGPYAQGIGFAVICK